MTHDAKQPCGRDVRPLMEGWTFHKPGEKARPVALPHTWNALDGRTAATTITAARAAMSAASRAASCRRASGCTSNCRGPTPPRT